MVALPWAIGSILFIHECIVDSNIARRKQTTQGIITAHEPAIHNRYGYSFLITLGGNKLHECCNLLH